MLNDDLGYYSPNGTPDKTLEKVRIFNLLFKKLVESNEMEEADVFKFISGIRAERNSIKKIKKSDSKKYLKEWHKSLFITRTNKKIRLGNSSSFWSQLNQENQKLMLEKMPLKRDSLSKEFEYNVNNYRVAFWLPIGETYG